MMHTSTYLISFKKSHVSSRDAECSSPTNDEENGNTRQADTGMNKITYEVSSREVLSKTAKETMLKSISQRVVPRQLF